MKQQQKADLHPQQAKPVTCTLAHQLKTIPTDIAVYDWIMILHGLLCSNLATPDFRTIELGLPRQTWGGPGCDWEASSPVTCDGPSTLRSLSHDTGWSIGWQGAHLTPRPRLLPDVPLGWRRSSISCPETAPGVGSLSGRLVTPVCQSPQAPLL